MLAMVVYPSSRFYSQAHLFDFVPKVLKFLRRADNERVSEIEQASCSSQERVFIQTLSQNPTPSMRFFKEKEEEEKILRESE